MPIKKAGEKAGKKAKKNTPGLAAQAKKKVKTRGKRVDSAMDRMLSGKSPQKKKTTPVYR